MVQFQKLTRNLFLTLHGHNVHRQQRQLSKFLMRYQQFDRSCLLRGCWASFQDGVAAGKVFPPRPRSKHEKRTAGACETWTVAAADGVRCARVRWEINFLLTFEPAPFICKRTVLHIIIISFRVLEVSGSVLGQDMGRLLLCVLLLLVSLQVYTEGMLRPSSAACPSES